jgi:CubicO group peptidase (beta-lactamase class C family)
LEDILANIKLQTGIFLLMKKLLTIVSLLSTPALLNAQIGDTTKQISAIFSSWNNATPGGSVSVSRGDDMLYEAAFGMADLEHNSPNTTGAIFEAGSVSKQFTATSLLMLASEGKVLLTDDVRKYIPELPKYNAPITIQHLLNHTSGLKDWGSVGSLTGWPRTTRVYTNQLALDIMCRQKSLNFTPGSEYSYSNANYILQVFIVERVSGQSLAEFTRIRLFEPLGMTSTQWRDNFREVIRDRAIAYSKETNVYEQDMPFENVHGHGGLLTTTGDLQKWNKLLDSHQVVGNDVAKWRIQRGKLNNGKEITYASGIIAGKFNGLDEIAHSGATAGYRAWLAYYPQKKLSIAILSNDGNSDVVGSGRKITALFLGASEVKRNEPAAVDVSEADLKKFTGTYRNIRSFDVFTIEYKEGKLWSNSHTLTPIHRDTIYWNGSKTYRSGPSKLTVNYGDTTSYVLVRSPDVTSSSLQSLAGKYYSEEAEVLFSIDIKDNVLWVKRGSFEPFKLDPSFRDAFFSESNQLFEFRRDRKGNVTGLDVSLPRAERIAFAKRK